MRTVGSEPNDGRRDVARAVAELADRLPDPIKAMARIAYNYRWSWLCDGALLFKEIDPARWLRSGRNPREMLERASPRRLRELAQRAAYVEHVRAAAAQIDADLARQPMVTAIPPERPVAYLCSEFGVHASLPLYGGGLGVLAGDVLKAASDLAFPMIGLGLMYREGYFHQRVDYRGLQTEYWLPNDFDRLPAALVTGADDAPLMVQVRMRGREVRVQVWRVDVGRVPLYLLDTDCDDNDVMDRAITGRLYVGDRHIRLAQYGILGIAGVRMLEAMGVRPSLFHLNEGHGTVSSMARVQLHMAATGESFEAALDAVRQRTVFTTHTPVPAGNEGYSRGEIEPVFGDFSRELGPRELPPFSLARMNPHNVDEPASITTLALRTSRAANGVSRRHGEVARAMWQPLWPDRRVEDVPIGHITNGVHLTSWMAASMQRLLSRHLGADWWQRRSDPSLWERIQDIPDEELWAERTHLRERLVQFVRERSIRDRINRGEDPEYVAAAARVFSRDNLTVGFARRVAVYKRLYLLTRLPMEGLHRMLSDGPTPVQVVVAGKAHPQDEEAKETLRQGFAMRHDPQRGPRIAFLEDYDLHMAPRIVAGVDLWLNLPRPPMEASGTSGMKVALNGGLNLSVLDGWWIEGYDGSNGWAIATPDGDPGYQDEHDAHALLDLVEHTVIPTFYERDPGGIPRRWLQMVKASMARLIPRFTAERMVSDYITSMYS
jgi:starch phosphorylase